MGFWSTRTPRSFWRGPMIMKTIQQFVQNVKWGDLEILIVDLPPGTGDAQLSLVQTLPLDGALIVTTPQPAAANVARKGGLMFQKVNVPLLGVAENMQLLRRTLRRPRITHTLFRRAASGSRRPPRSSARSLLWPDPAGFWKSARGAIAGCRCGELAPEPRRGKIPGHGGGGPRPPRRAGQAAFVTIGKYAGIDSRPPGALISFASVYRCMSPSSKEPDSSSRDFVKQSSLYQEFLAEREEILKHKWLESERLSYGVGFGARPARLDSQAPCEGWQGGPAPALVAAPGVIVRGDHDGRHGRPLETRIDRRAAEPRPSRVKLSTREGYRRQRVGGHALHLGLLDLFMQRVAPQKVIVFHLLDALGHGLLVARGEVTETGFLFPCGLPCIREATTSCISLKRWKGQATIREGGCAISKFHGGRSEVERLVRKPLCDSAEEEATSKPTAWGQAVPP